MRIALMAVDDMPTQPEEYKQSILKRMGKRKRQKEQGTATAVAAAAKSEADLCEEVEEFFLRTNKYMQYETEHPLSGTFCVFTSFFPLPLTPSKMNFLQLHTISLHHQSAQYLKVAPSYCTINQNSPISSNSWNHCCFSQTVLWGGMSTGVLIFFFFLSFVRLLRVVKHVAPIASSSAYFDVQTAKKGLHFAGFRNRSKMYLF